MGGQGLYINYSLNSSIRVLEADRQNEREARRQRTRSERGFSSTHKRKKPSTSKDANSRIMVWVLGTRGLIEAHKGGPTQTLQNKKALTLGKKRLRSLLDES